MNKVIGTMTTKQEAILVGDHHIVTQGAIADEEAAFAGGTLLYKGEDGYQAFASNDETNSPVAVALDALEAAASDAVVPIVVNTGVFARPNHVIFLLLCHLQICYFCRRNFGEAKVHKIWIRNSPVGLS